MLAAANVYRARSQSITIDEASTYLDFVDPPVSQILTTYSSNHHVLHNLLCKASVSMFGLSDLTLRIPSLLGGFLYFAVVLLIGRRLHGSGWLMLLCVCLMSLHPLILDLCSIARGYSLALAFYLLGLYCLTRFIAEPDRSSPASVAAAGALLGLSVGANLTLGPPILALNMVFVLTLLLRSSESRWRRLLPMAYLLIPEVALAGAVNAGPLAHARCADWQGGYNSVFETLKNLAVSSVWHQWSNRHVWKIGIEFFPWIFPACRIAILIALVIAIVAAIGIVAGWARSRRISLEDSWIWFCGASLLFLIAILIALHRLLGMPYPMGRMVIFVWHLLVFPGLLLMRRGLAGRAVPKAIAGLYAAFCMLLVLQFALQFNVDRYAGFAFGAGTKRVARFLRQDTSGASHDIRITSSSSLVTSLTFYRKAWSMRRWLPIEMRTPQLDAASDYVVLDQFDTPAGIPSGLRTLFVDPLSGATVTAHR